MDFPTVFALDSTDKEQMLVLESKYPIELLLLVELPIHADVLTEHFRNNLLEIFQLERQAATKHHFAQAVTVAAHHFMLLINEIVYYS
jgi:hypothetical protein